MRMKTIEPVATILAVIGAINWGLVGLADFNIIETIFGSVPMLLTVVYALIALSGLLVLYARFARK